MKSDSTHRSLALFSRRQCMTTLAHMAGALSLGSASAWSAALPEVEASTELDAWQRMRAQWLLNPRLVWFDTARQAPALRAVLAAHYRALEALHSDPMQFYATRLNASAVRELLNRLAAWADCSADEVCATRGDNQPLQALADQVVLQEGDEIVVSSQLSAPLQLYWQQRAERAKAQLITVHLPMPLNDAEQVISAFTQACSEHTRVLCIAHVQPLDGRILPLQALCALARDHGAISLVDGSLAAGAVPISLRESGCDGYAASLCHWVQGTPPCALLYARSDWQSQWSLTAQRNGLTETPYGIATEQWPLLQRRWPNELISLAAAFQAIPVALQWQNILGRSASEQRLLRLYTYLRINLQSMPDVRILTCNQPGMQLHLLALQPLTRSPAAVANWLQRNDNVIVGVASHPLEATATLRISLNVGNSLDDLDRLIQGLRRGLIAA